MLKRQTLADIKKREFGKGFMAGIACTVATLNREHDQPTLCEDLLRGFGCTYEEYRKAGADQLDLAELRKIRRDEDWRCAGSAQLE